MRKVLLVVSGSICIVAGAPPTIAGPRYEEVSTAVQYHDLDLGRPSDVRELHRRLRKSAAELCTRERDYNGPRAYLPDRDCTTDALAATQTQVARALAQASPGKSKGKPESSRGTRATSPPAR